MLAALRDADRVDKEVEALLRQQKCQIGVLLHHIEVVAGVIRRDPCLATLHLVEDLIHDIRLHQVLFLAELLRSGGKLVRVFGVDAQTQLKLRDGKCVARIVKHEDLAGVGGIPQKLPAGDVLLPDVARVVDNADAAPGIGDGVAAFGIVGGVAEALVEIGGVGDIGIVQRFEHILRDQLFDHIVRREDDVEGRAAGLELGVHTLVAVKGHIVDLDVGVSRFKLRDDVDALVRAVGDILAPVIDIDRHGFVCGLNRCGKDGQKQQRREDQRGHTLLHTPCLLTAATLRRLLLSRACRRFIVTIRIRMTRNISVNMA